MTSKTAFFISILALTLAPIAQADIEVKFTESAPKDSFSIKNTSSCTLENLTLDIDLTKTVGRLIFDTTSTGAGVEVFQPFEVTSGDIKVVSPEGVRDGDNKVSISIKRLASGKSASFTIDVDDTLPKSALGNIRVAGSEIANGLVTIRSQTLETTTATFSSSSKATLKLPACT